MSKGSTIVHDLNSFRIQLFIGDHELFGANASQELKHAFHLFRHWGDIGNQLRVRHFRIVIVLVGGIAKPVDRVIVARFHSTNLSDPRSEAQAGDLGDEFGLIFAGLEGCNDFIIIRAI